jgi:hypothetical protein
MSGKILGYCLMTSQMPAENAAGIFEIAISVTLPPTRGQFIVSSALNPVRNTRTSSFTDEDLGFSTG